MELSLNRLLLPIWWMGIISIFIGCTSTIEVDEKSPLAHVDVINNVSDEGIHTSKLNQIQISKVLLFSKNGIEIEMNPSLFQEKWEVYSERLEEKEGMDFKHRYTLVIWDKQNQPYVLQMSDKGLKVGQLYYSNHEGLHFHKWLHHEIGRNYLQTMNVKQLFLAALDLSNIKKQVSEKETEEVIHLLQSATLVHGDVRIDTPLYPNYELYIELITNGNVIITVLTPTLVSVKDGTDTWYYQLPRSIFSQVKRTIPIPLFSPQHINHVFEADNLIVNREITLGQIYNVDTESIEIKALIHEMSRILSIGQARANQSLSSNILKDQEQIHLEFVFSERESTNVIVLNDYYTLNDTVYYLEGVGKRIHKLVSAD
jgi:hypothetical protein